MEMEESLGEKFTKKVNGWTYLQRVFLQEAIKENMELQTKSFPNFRA